MPHCPMLTHNICHSLSPVQFVPFSWRLVVVCNGRVDIGKDQDKHGKWPGSFYGPIDVNVCNFRPLTSRKEWYTYEGCSMKVNKVHCGKDVSANVCGHNAKVQGVVINLYRIRFSLFWPFDHIEEQANVMVNNDEELIGLSIVKFQSMCLFDQLDFLRWITLEGPLYLVWLKVEEKTVIVTHLIVLDGFSPLEHVTHNRHLKHHVAST